MSIKRSRSSDKRTFLFARPPHLYKERRAAASSCHGTHRHRGYGRPPVVASRTSGHFPFLSCACACVLSSRLPVPSGRPKRTKEYTEASLLVFQTSSITSRPCDDGLLSFLTSKRCIPPKVSIGHNAREFTSLPNPTVDAQVRRLR